MMSYREIGEYFGCCAENIRKIERKALLKLAADPEALRVFREYKDHQGIANLWQVMENMSDYPDAAPRKKRKRLP
jgi:NADPH-dependent 7-cyano-7-deazaguanine reductase QueF